MQRKKLGKGLSALFSEQTNLNLGMQKSPYVQLPVDSIKPDPNQPRKIFKEKYLAELAESIGIHGVIQPIVIMKDDDDTFKIISGERRWRASKIAGKNTIPCVIKDIDFQTAQELALIENIQRQELSVLEQAQGLQQLLQDSGITHEQIAKRLGKSRSYVSNVLRLLNLPVSVKKMLENKEISYGHAKLLVSNEKCEEIAKRIAQNNLSVRQTEELIASEYSKTNVSDTAHKPSKTKKSHEIKEIEKLISKNLGLAVNIKLGNKNKGSMKIDFSSIDELDGLLRNLSKISNSNSIF